MQARCQLLENAGSRRISTASSFDDIVNHKFDDLRIFGKNLQSIQTDAREEELLAEVEFLEWDIIFLNETWRAERQEKWKTHEGHLFCGSGGTPGSRGVAILMNKRLTSGFKAFNAVSERLCFIDCKIFGFAVRLISVYFPHGGYEDEVVEGLYYEMDKVVEGARRQHRICMILGDWNAVVGQRQEGDDHEAVGTHGVGRRNERGTCMASWAGRQSMAIATTCVEKRFEEQWTHFNGDVKRQIDYFCICSKRIKWVVDAGASEDIGVGKDHRTVYAHLKLPRISRHAKKGCSRGSNLKGWKTKDSCGYRDESNAKLRSIPRTLSAKDKYDEVERILVSTGKKYQAKKEREEERTNIDAKKKLKEFIDQRREARRQGNKEEVKRYSKFIQKEIKAIAKATKTSKVARLLEEFKDIGQIKDIKKKGKKECINAIVNKEGKEASDVNDIAEAFADFYEALYKESADEVYDYKLKDKVAEAPPVQPEEIRVQLRKMKKGRAADDAGIVSELLDEASDELIQAIADIFSAILRPGEAIPAAWKSSSIRVLFKKGNPKLPENYRPICIIPILYKIFSKVICERIREPLLKAQSYDQAGFRPGYSCDDHLFTVTLLAEKCKEFNIPLWAAAVDFSKAFDSISHRSIFESLQKQGVPTVYLDVLARLYSEQHAHVRGECRSRDFPIGKGTKQGDPISPLIFNAVLEEVMQKVKEKWTKRKYGVQLEPGLNERLTNLRFADDILLIGTTLPQIKQMLADMAEECSKVGLKLHPDKTKILHNNKGYGRHVKEAKAGDMVIEVLGADCSTMYLGRLLSITDPHDTEMQHRTKKAWGKFATYRDELTNKDVPLKLRMKLFHSVVTPTMLYGCSSWVMTATREKKVQGTQMRMMRIILKRPRKVDENTGDKEDWVTWVRRTTAEAREKQRTYKIDDWTKIVKTRQQKWKAKVEALDLNKWAKQAFEWQPIGFRRVGRPLKRWNEDDGDVDPAKED